MMTETNKNQLAKSNKNAEKEILVLMIMQIIHNKP